MTVDQILNQTLYDTYIQLIIRILDTSIVPEGEPIAMLDNDDELSFYERLIVHQNLVKPELSRLESELVEYKEELVQAFRADVAQRLSALLYVRESMAALEWISGSYTNLALFMDGIRASNDTVILEQLETKELEITPEMELIAEIEEDEKSGAEDEQICQGIHKIIGGHNKKNNLTATEIIQLKEDFSQVFDCIIMRMPKTVKTLVAAATGHDNLRAKILKYLEMRGI